MIVFLHNAFRFAGGASLDLNSVEPKPKKWILDMTWLNLVQLSRLYPFNHLLVQVVKNEKSWKAWFDEEAPEKAVIPDGYDSLLDQFRKLLLVRSWCPDHTVAQVRHTSVQCLCHVTSPVDLLVPNLCCLVFFIITFVAE